MTRCRWKREKKPALAKKLAEKWGAVFGVSPALLTTIMKKESSFCPVAESPAGAIGFGQQRPELLWWKIGKLEDAPQAKRPDVARSIARWKANQQKFGREAASRFLLYVPDFNVMISAFQLASHVREFPKLSQAIAAYHQGDSSVRLRLREGRPAVVPGSLGESYVRDVMAMLKNR